MVGVRKLNELEATAICGNDISSSCLYVSALAILYAGQYAWISLLIVAVVLWLFRRIYGEVVGALPLNGGAYNVLLNTTSKNNASLAACLTILSYMATAVLSATEAMHYLHHILPEIHVVGATVIVLALFLALTLIGISESAKTAVGIFLFHLFCLTLLACVAVWYLTVHGFATLQQNFSLPVQHGSVAKALFFGFSAAMLGISGFESSANFVEEQAQGVFPKTLRNMWIVVSIFNPLLALIVLGTLSMPEVAAHKEALLSYLGDKVGGVWLSTLISLDAIAVLSGAVLTSFVGVSGLIKRMALDRIFPQFFLLETHRQSNYVILTSFFLLCLSILFLTKGNIGPLSGVYTISFLSVMAYFALGNFLLKIKRSKLPRPVYASVPTVIMALVAVILALYGNIKVHPEYLVVFLQYFVPAMLFIYASLKRQVLMNYTLLVLRSFSESVRVLALRSRAAIRQRVHRLQSQEFVFFTKGHDLATLNRVMIYVQENEVTNKLKIVAILREGETVDQSFLDDLAVLDRAYPHIRIEFVTRVGTFGPDIIDQLSKEWHIPKNFMFISSPGDRFPYNISELGGVRLII
ncbi:MAG: APC family permease [Bacteroidota bacterium]|nr:APC family permease [Candidatus Kapabacteria bacterium]MDW8219911.1 APC family permease [Bacteroidota bacterium]